MRKTQAAPRSVSRSQCIGIEDPCLSLRCTGGKSFFLCALGISELPLSRHLFCRTTQAQRLFGMPTKPVGAGSEHFNIHYLQGESSGLCCGLRYRLYSSAQSVWIEILHRPALGSRFSGEIERGCDCISACTGAGGALWGEAPDRTGDTKYGGCGIPQDEERFLMSGCCRAGSGSITIAPNGSGMVVRAHGGISGWREKLEDRAGHGILWN